MAFKKRNTPKHSPAERTAFEKHVRAQLATVPDAVDPIDDSPSVHEARLQQHTEAVQKTVNRYLIDFAYTGRCGDPLRSAPGNVGVALTMAEHADNAGLAVSEPLRDLHWILENGDSKECAQGVGAAWRAQHPFRPAVDGDPYSVLAPHLSRAVALIALDRAAALSSLPPMRLVRLDREVEHVLESTPVYEQFCDHNPCTREVALDLGVQAREAWERVQTRSYMLSARVRKESDYQKYLRRLRGAVIAIVGWLNDPNCHDATSPMATAAQFTDEAYSYLVNARSILPEAELRRDQTRTLVESLSNIDNLSEGARARLQQDAALANEELAVALFEAVVEDESDTSVIHRAASYINAFVQATYKKAKKLEARRQNASTLQERSLRSRSRPHNWV